MVAGTFTVGAISERKYECLVYEWENTFTDIVSQQFYQYIILFFITQVYVLKRPHVDEFLQRVGELFECVLFTASLAKV